MYQEKCLREILGFLSDNCPHPRQSLAETEKILDRLASNLKEEITANLAERDGYRGDMYVEYLHEKLESFDEGLFIDLDPDVMEMDLFRDLAGEGYDRFRGMTWVRVYHREDSPEVKEKKVKAMGVAISRYDGIVSELLAFADKECFEVCDERLRLHQKKDGVSSKLKRLHEDPYRFALGYQITTNISQDLRDMKFRLQLIPVATANLITEIEENRETHKKAVVKPYLQLLKDRMSRELKLAEELSAPFCQFSAEVDETEIRKKAGWVELQDLLQQVQNLRLSSLKKICRHLDLQFKMGPRFMDSTDQLDYYTSDHQDFLMLIMNGTINLLFSGEETEGPLRNFKTFLDIPEAEILQKIENLHHPDRMTEEELTDFHLVQNHLERSWHGRYRTYYESDVVNNFPQGLFPLEEFEEFLKAHERWKSRNFAVE